MGAGAQQPLGGAPRRGSVRVIRSRVRHRRRSTVGFAAVCAAALGIGAFPALASAGTAPKVHRDLRFYVLFATDQLSFQGSQGGPSHIANGDIGVNNADTDPHGASLNICQAGAVHMDPGSQVVADSVQGSAPCDVANLFANTSNGTPPIAPRDSGPTKFDLPIIASLPPFPVFACDNGSPKTVPQAGALDLAPGTYGDLRLQDLSKLTLHGGTYTFCNWAQGKNVTVVDQADTIIQIAGGMNLNDNASFGSVCDAQIFVQSIGVNPISATVAFGHNSTVTGRFWVPRGRIALGHATDLTGRFFARQINTDWNVDVTGCGGPPPPTTTSSSTTTSSTTTTSTTIHF